MIARHYVSADAIHLDRILDSGRPGFDVRLDRDRIAVIGQPASGCLIWRPGSVVHELRIAPGLSRHSVADSLVNFAIADAMARPSLIWEAVFLTDSDEFARYALSIGALEQDGKRVFRLPVRG